VENALMAGTGPAIIRPRIGVRGRDARPGIGLLALLATRSIAHGATRIATMEQRGWGTMRA
jgi:hypothetical protein